MEGSAIFTTQTHDDPSTNAVLAHQRRQHELNLAIQFHGQVASRICCPSYEGPSFLCDAEKAAFEAACRLLCRTLQEGI